MLTYCYLILKYMVKLTVRLKEGRHFLSMWWTNIFHCILFDIFLLLLYKCLKIMKLLFSIFDLDLQRFHFCLKFSLIRYLTYSTKSRSTDDAKVKRLRINKFETDFL